MPSRFHTCLAVTLRCETSYGNAPGGPYLRNGRGLYRHDQGFRLPSQPDGLAFDDDPADTGGRTCMGLLQREYDPWRRSQGLPPRDVWLIEDAEIDAIYRAQYWQAVRCEDLPEGVDLAVFDAAVNCGVGMAARFLQRGLGVRDDGHIGIGTMDAVRASDPATLVRGIMAAREAYHRKCKTFAVHGRGWLKRCAAIESEALALVGKPSSPVPSDLRDAARWSSRATPDAPASFGSETNTGQREMINGAAGAGLTVTQGLDLAERVDRIGAMQAIMQSPITLALIVVGVLLLLNARTGWIDRGRKLIMGV